MISDRVSSGNTSIPCIVLAKDGNSQETFPVLQKEKARDPDLSFNPSVNNLVSKANAELKYRVIRALVRPMSED